MSWRAIVAQAPGGGIYTAPREAMTDIHGDAASREARLDRAGDGLLPPVSYTREDESSDDRFYAFPRRVVHIDDGAIAALGRLYAEVLPAGGRLLDLMSSWRSHLPAGFQAREVVGLGLNAEEMADNPQLTSHVVHDVNRRPQLPFGSGEFDGAMCAVSIQYVIHPLLVFREVRRVLRPGSPFVVSFSNRCFPTKAVAVWLDSTDQHHMMLVRSYFEAAGGWTDTTAEDRSPGGYGDPLYTVWSVTTKLPPDGAPAT
jgi:SAM-dependent methyltransferase